MSEGALAGYLPEMSEQPEIARPDTADPGRAEDRHYRPGDGEPPDRPEEADSVGAAVIGELRERRES